MSSLIYPEKSYILDNIKKLISGYRLPTAGKYNGFLYQPCVTSGILKNKYKRVSYNGFLYQPSKLRMGVRFPLPAQKRKGSDLFRVFLFRVGESNGEGSETGRFPLAELFKPRGLKAQP